MYDPGQNLLRRFALLLRRRDSHFRCNGGKSSKAPSVYAVLRDNAAAWKAGTDICGDLIRGITDSLTPTEPEWSVAVLDETGKTLSRFRVVAETLFPASVT